MIDKKNLCSKCGESLQPGSKICPFCGEALKPTPPPIPQAAERDGFKKGNMRKKILLTVLAGALVILLAGWIIPAAVQNRRMAPIGVIPEHPSEKRVQSFWNTVKDETEKNYGDNFQITIREQEAVFLGFSENDHPVTVAINNSAKNQIVLFDNGVQYTPRTFKLTGDSPRNPAAYEMVEMDDYPEGTETYSYQSGSIDEIAEDCLGKILNEEDVVNGSWKAAPLGKDGFSVIIHPAESSRFNTIDLTLDKNGAMKSVWISYCSEENDEHLTFSSLSDKNLEKMKFISKLAQEDQISEIYLSDFPLGPMKPKKLDLTDRGYAVLLIPEDAGPDNVLLDLLVTASSPKAFMGLSGHSYVGDCFMTIETLSSLPERTNLLNGSKLVRGLNVENGRADRQSTEQLIETLSFISKDRYYLITDDDIVVFLKDFNDYDQRRFETAEYFADSYGSEDVIPLDEVRSRLLE